MPAHHDRLGCGQVAGVDAGVGGVLELEHHRHAGNRRVDPRRDLVVGGGHRDHADVHLGTRPHFAAQPDDLGRQACSAAGRARGDCRGFCAVEAFEGQCRCFVERGQHHVTTADRWRHDRHGIEGLRARTGSRVGVAGEVGELACSDADTHRAGGIFGRREFQQVLHVVDLDQRACRTAGNHDVIDRETGTDGFTEREGERHRPRRGGTCNVVVDDQCGCHLV